MTDMKDQTNDQLLDGLLEAKSTLNELVAIKAERDYISAMLTLLSEIRDEVRSRMRPDKLPKTYRCSLKELEHNPGTPFQPVNDNIPGAEKLAVLRRGEILAEEEGVPVFITEGEKRGQIVYLSREVVVEEIRK